MKTIRQLFYAFVLSFLVNESNAQVQELGGKLIVMKASSEAAVKNEADQLNTLMYDSKPTLYCQNNHFTRVGEQKPVRLIADVSSIQSLSASDPLYDQVQVICIKVQNVNDLNSVLKLSDLSGFVKLKYICFQCSFNPCADQSGNSACEVEKISKMVRVNENTHVKVLYTVSIDN